MVARAVPVEVAPGPSAGTVRVPPSIVASLLQAAFRDR
jgi:hypothetical protein